MQKGLESCILVPPPEQMPLDIKKLLRKKKAESPGFSTGVEFQPHSSSGQLLGTVDLRV